MIELPEAEVLRRDLEREVVTKKVKSLEILATKQVGGAAGKTKLAALVDSAKVVGVSRRAAALLLHIDGGGVIAIQLGDDAYLRRHNPKDEVEKKTIWVMSFAQGGQLRLVDPSGTSSTLTTTLDTVDNDIPALGELGLDPVEQAMSWIAFARHLLQHQGRVRALLRDDHVVTGIGPLYVDEILFEAGLRYDREIASLNEQELRRLYRSTVEVLHDAVKHRGTTLPDRPFTDLAGKAGGYQELRQVYQREGELSPRSRRPIVSAVVDGETTYYCEQSQV
jgi:formamidopyrimidine-DNA glycosylase